MNNRPLKFRAWDKATSRMYPEFHIFGETTCFDLLKRWLMEFPNGKTSFERMNDVEVMQFTGLADKDGKDIFEGDILMYHYSYNEAMESAAIGNGDVCEIETVSFEKGGFRFKGLKYYDLSDGCEEMKVIGNIFQHPHLLAE